MKDKLKILSELTKVKITSFVTITTGFGYIAYSGVIDTAIILPLAGILFLAFGSATLNHLQEYKTDSLMERTKNRPIPSGRISVNSVIYLTILLVILGSVLLYIGAGLIALLLGLLNLFWYNVIYTPLKKKSPLAIIPGSLVGAIPPVVGWVAAGGYIFDPPIILIAFFFFIWQVPHFWLLLLVLDKDYRKAGFPTLTEIFDKPQLSRITFIWIVATVITSLLIPLFNIVNNSSVYFTLLAAGIILTIDSVKMLRQTENNLSFSFAFRHINYFALFFVIIVSVDKLFIS